jgi:thiol:disulfide interchange protein
MACPETVKQALEELAAVKKVVMHLARDEFAVTYNSSQITPETLLATIKQAGYTAQVVTGREKSALAATLTVLPSGFPMLDDVLVQAKKEGKLIVLDFTAEWCSPCQQMEKTTFADARVKELLARCVVVKIDTDKEEKLTQQLGVERLPDIRFVSPDGKVMHRLRGFQEADAFANELARFIRLVGREK